MHLAWKDIVTWEDRRFSFGFTISLREENLLKISRRVKEYKVEVLNPPREGKKLLVLDVDYTLFGELVKALGSFFTCNSFVLPIATHVKCLKLPLLLQK